MNTTTTTTTEQQPTSLLLRATALKCRTRKPRLNSFCVPKETTSTLLDFHCEDEPENDVASTSTTPASEPLNRRKASLMQRNAHKKQQRKNSFRVPSEMTQQLLLLKFATKINEEYEDLDQSEPATVSKPPAPPADNTKLRRVRAMQKYLAKVSIRRNSFCLPKETTKQLLQIHADHEKEEEEEILPQDEDEETLVSFPTEEVLEEEANAVEEAVRIAQEAEDALKMAMEDQEQYLCWSAAQQEEEKTEEDHQSFFPTPKVLEEEVSAVLEAERIAQEAQTMLRLVREDQSQYKNWAKEMRIRSFQQQPPQPQEEEEETTQDSDCHQTTTTNAADSNKSIRCEALKQHHTRKMRLTSFRLPQENIKTLLHLFTDADEESSDDDLVVPNNKTALPPKMLLKSSISARTA